MFNSRLVYTWLRGTMFNSRLVYKAKQTPSGVVVVRRKEANEWFDSIDIHYNGEVIEVELKQNYVVVPPKVLQLDKVREVTLTSESLLEILIDEIAQPRGIKNYCKGRGFPLV